MVNPFNVRELNDSFKRFEMALYLSVAFCYWRRNIGIGAVDDDSAVACYPKGIRTRIIRDEATREWW